MLDNIDHRRRPPPVDPRRRWYWRAATAIHAGQPRLEITAAAVPAPVKAAAGISTPSLPAPWRCVRRSPSCVTVVSPAGHLVTCPSIHARFGGAYIVRCHHMPSVTPRQRKKNLHVMRGWRTGLLPSGQRARRAAVTAAAGFVGRAPGDAVGHAHCDGCTAVVGGSCPLERSHPAQPRRLVAVRAFARGEHDVIGLLMVARRAPETPERHGDRCEVAPLPFVEPRPWR